MYNIDRKLILIFCKIYLHTHITIRCILLDATLFLGITLDAKLQWGSHINL